MRAPMAAHSGPFQFAVVSDLEGLRSLGPEWNELQRGNLESTFSQSHDWCRVALETSEYCRGRLLHCLTARAGGRLALVWPFLIHEEGRTRIARRLGCGFVEDNALLLARECESTSLLPEAWRKLKASLPADFVELGRVAQGSPLAAVIASSERVRARDLARLTEAEWHAFAKWEDYLSTRSSKYQSQIRRKGRRLGEQGAVTFEMVAEADGFARLIEWTWQHKLEWMRAADRSNPWVRWTDYVGFLKALRALPEGSRRLVFFVLRLDGAPVATEFVVLDPARFQWIIGAFEERWSKFSPGQILQAHCLKWAFEHGLVYEFGIGDEPFKNLWANRVRELAYVTVPLSPRGYVRLISRAVVKRAKKALSLRRTASSLGKLARAPRPQP